MYSLVMLAAMTAGPDLPGHYQSPVTPSNYGNGFWTGGDFFECCAPAGYGWVTCWTKGFGYYPGAALGLGEECAASHPSFYRPAACCGACGSAPGGGCGWCGYGGGVACPPAYYTSVIGCPPHLSAPPYAHYRQCNPCCNLNFPLHTRLNRLAHGARDCGVRWVRHLRLLRAHANAPPADHRRPAAIPASGIPNSRVRPVRPGADAAFAERPDPARATQGDRAPAQGPGQAPAARAEE